MPIETRQDLLLKSLKAWYDGPKDRLKTLYEIVEGKSKISLRAIDFLCTNYAKKNDIVYYIGKSPFNLFLMYRGQLKAYSKLQFDPFRRHSRIQIACPHSPNRKLETTVAQLNFFKWAFENKVLDYLTNNLGKIETSMGSITTKKQNITASVKKVAKRHNVKVTVTFQ